MHSVGQLCTGGRGRGGVDNLRVPRDIKVPGNRSLSFGSKGSPWNLVATMSDVTALWCPNTSYNLRNHQLRQHAVCLGTGGSWKRLQCNRALPVGRWWEPPA